jgi:hypothetical protein
MLFALVSTLVFFLAIPVHSAQAACSNATLYNMNGNGTYTWSESYTYPYGGAFVGMVTFLSNGTWTAAIYGGFKGAESLQDISGTYSVNSNCTVTLTWPSGFDVLGDIVSSGNEVFLDTAYSGNTCFLYLESLGTMNCSDATLYNAENYGVAAQVWYPALGNDTGYLTFTAPNSVAGEFWGSVTGSGGQYIISGTYTVTDSCVVTVNLTSPGVITWQGVVQSSGHQAFFTQTSPTGLNDIMVFTKM